MPDSNPGPLPQKSGALTMSLHIPLAEAKLTLIWTADLDSVDVKLTLIRTALKLT